MPKFYPFLAADFRGVNSAKTLLCDTLVLSHHCLETGRIRFPESTVSNTKLSELFGPHRVPGRELSESRSSLQNPPSLLQKSVSSLFRNSTLETVFRPFPHCTCAVGPLCQNSSDLGHSEQSLKIWLFLLCEFGVCCPWKNKEIHKNRCNSRIWGFLRILSLCFQENTPNSQIAPFSRTGWRTCPFLVCWNDS